MKKLLAILFAVTTLNTASASATEYIDISTPNIDSSFKTYMDYRTITSQSSDQYKYIDRWGWSDYDGFMRCDGERDLGITDDYYLIAMGSHYGTEIGSKYRITTDTGNIFYGCLADQKDDSDTNSTHQWSYNDDVIEFIVDTRKLPNVIKLYGNCNVYMPLNGKIAKIEKIIF